MSDYSRGDYADLPAGKTDLENNYTAPDLTAIASNDNSTYAEQTANNEIAIHQYKKTVTGQFTNITWSGKSSLAPSESPVILEVYNVDDTAWEELDRDDSTAADTDFKAIRQAYPNQPFMSEVADIVIALAAQCPFTYQGYGDSGSGGPVITCNHPIRTALTASYYWHRDYRNGIAVKENVMAGALPRIILHNRESGGITTTVEWQDWACAVVSLYCRFRLWHDLPPAGATWASTTLAYFRSNTVSLFRFEDRGSNVYAFVEEHWQGDYDRLVVDDGTIITNNIEEDLPNSYYTRGSYISLPSGDTDLETPYTVDDMADVAIDDTDMVAQSATSQLAIHQFKHQINGAGGIINTVARVTIPCSTSTAYLQIYNRSGSPAWETIDYDDTTGINTDFPLSASIADLTDYKDINNIVACRVYQEMQ